MNKNKFEKINKVLVKIETIYFYVGLCVVLLIVFFGDKIGIQKTVKKYSLLVLFYIYVCIETVRCIFKIVDSKNFFVKERGIPIIFFPILMFILLTILLIIKFR